MIACEDKREKNIYRRVSDFSCEEKNGSGYNPIPDKVANLKVSPKQSLCFLILYNEFLKLEICNKMEQ